MSEQKLFPKVLSAPLEMEPSESLFQPPLKALSLQRISVEHNSQSSFLQSTSLDPLPSLPPLTSNTFLFVSASSPLSIYLPSANVNGLVCYIKKIDDTDNAVTLVPSGSQKIDNSSSKIITIPYTAVSLVVNEGNWWVF